MSNVIMSGPLTEFDVPSVLQAVNMSGQPTILRLWDDRNQPSGMIRLGAGQLLAADSRQKVGEDAVRAILHEPHRHSRFAIERVDTNDKAGGVPSKSPSNSKGLGQLSSFLLEQPQPHPRPPGKPESPSTPSAAKPDNQMSSGVTPPRVPKTNPPLAPLGAPPPPSQSRGPDVASSTSPTAPDVTQERGEHRRPRTAPQTSLSPQRQRGDGPRPPRAGARAGATIDANAKSEQKPQRTVRKIVKLEPEIATLAHQIEPLAGMVITKLPECQLCRAWHREQPVIPDDAVALYIAMITHAHRRCFVGRGTPQAYHGTTAGITLELPAATLILHGISAHHIVAFSFERETPLGLARLVVERVSQPLSRLLAVELAETGADPSARNSDAHLGH